MFLKSCDLKLSIHWEVSLSFDKINGAWLYFGYIIAHSTAIWLISGAVFMRWDYHYETISKSFEWYMMYGVLWLKNTVLKLKIFWNWCLCHYLPATFSFVDAIFVSVFKILIEQGRCLFSILLSDYAWIPWICEWWIHWICECI